MSDPTPSPTPTPSASAAPLTVKDTWTSPGGFEWQLMSDGLTFSISAPANVNIDANTMKESIGGPWDSCQALFDHQGAGGWEPESDAVKTFRDQCTTLDEEITKAANAATSVAGTIETVNPWIKIVTDAMTIVGAFVPFLGSLASEIKDVEVKADDVAQKLANEAVAAFQVTFDLAEAKANALTKNAVVPDIQSVFDAATKMLGDVGNIIKAATS